MSRVSVTVSVLYSMFFMLFNVLFFFILLFSATKQKKAKIHTIYLVQTMILQQTLILCFSAFFFKSHFIDYIISHIIMNSKIHHTIIIYISYCTLRNSVKKEKKTYK